MIPEECADGRTDRRCDSCEDVVLLEAFAARQRLESKGTFSPYLASHHFVAHEGEVNAIRFSPQGKYMATAGADRKVKLWKEEGGKADLAGTLTG